MKKALVCGASGFIERHLVKKLNRQGCWIGGDDIWVEAQVKTQLFLQATTNG